MTRFCLALARICSAMWVGAALLFVITSVTEQLDPSFDAAARDRLALIRFPWYYGTGATMLFLTLVATLLAGRKRLVLRIAFLAVLLAGGVMAIDYAFVYRPLRADLSSPGEERSVRFEQLHAWSERLNAAGFLLSGAAAVLLHVGREASREKSK